MFRSVALVVLLAGCAGGSLEEESSADLTSEAAALLPAPGCYTLTMPFVSATTERGCSVIAVATVEIAADDTAQIDPCPLGWSCSHADREPLGATYNPVWPKSNGTVCTYDVTAGTYKAFSPDVCSPP